MEPGAKSGLDVEKYLEERGLKVDYPLPIPVGSDAGGQSGGEQAQATASVSVVVEG